MLKLYLQLQKILQSIFNTSSMYGTACHCPVKLGLYMQSLRVWTVSRRN